MKQWVCFTCSTSKIRVLLSLWGVQFEGNLGMFGYCSEPEQVVKMGKEEMEASADPCLHFCFPLSTRGQGGAQQACDSQFSRLTQSVAWALVLSCPCCPPCGVWGLCPFLFLLSSTPMLPALDLHPPSHRPHQTCLPPASECQSPLQLLSAFSEL